MQLMQQQHRLVMIRLTRQIVMQLMQCSAADVRLDEAEKTACDAANAAADAQALVMRLVVMELIRQSVMQLW